MGKYLEQAKAARRKEALNKEWYTLRSILGNDWAIFYFLLGGREAGKSYATTDFFLRQFKLYGRPFYWLRLTDASQKKLLMNNAEKLIDPDLRRKYNIECETIGDSVYSVTTEKVITSTGKEKEVKKKVFLARVMALSTFYNDKGSGLFDKDFLSDPNMYYNICLDEMNREANEKNTFDIVYAFTNQLENLVRSTKQRLRVICIGNTLQEASDILCAFNFLPQDFGRFYLKKKRAVIEYIEPSEKYKTRRKGTVADILMPNASTFTNKVKVDESLVHKGKLYSPTFIIKFAKDENMWYTLWDGRVIKKYNGEQCRAIAMRPFIDEKFNTEQRNNIIVEFDQRYYRYRDLITFKTFQKDLELLRPSR